MKFHYFVEALGEKKEDHLTFFARCGKVLQQPQGSFNPEAILNAYDPCQSCVHHIEQEFPSLIALRMTE